MSEEVIEETETVEEVEQAEESNPLYKTLFDVAEEATQDVAAEEENLGSAITLNDAVRDLDKEPDPVREVVQEEVEPEPVKAEPKKKKLRKVVDPDIPEDVAKQPAFQHHVEEDLLVSDEDKEFMEDLIPDEKVVFEKILYADKKLGGEYTGSAKKFKTYIKKNKEYLGKKMKEDDFYDPSQDEEYKTFIATNKPEFSRADEDKVHREMILEEADKRTAKKTSQQISELEKKIQKYEVQPKVEAAKASFRQVAQNTVIPEEYRKALSEGGAEAIQKLAEDNPFEYQILENFSQQLLTYSDALTDIFLDPSVSLDIENNQIHKDLNQWLEKEQENFIQSGQTEQDGKLFMRRERYYQIPENKRSEYYTWSDNDLMKILALRYQDLVANAIQEQRSQLEKAGYAKQGVSETPRQQAPTQRAPTPKPPVVPTTARQGTTVAQPKAKASTPNSALLGALGL